VSSRPYNSYNAGKKYADQRFVKSPAKLASERASRLAADRAGEVALSSHQAQQEALRAKLTARYAPKDRPSDVLMPGHSSYGDWTPWQVVNSGRIQKMRVNDRTMQVEMIDITGKLIQTTLTYGDGGWTDWVYVVSSNVEAGRYAEDTEVLQLKFLPNRDFNWGKRGTTLYTYYNVTPYVWRSFLNAPSKGTWVWDILRGRGWSGMGQFHIYDYTSADAAGSFERGDPYNTTGSGKDRMPVVKRN